MLPITYLNPAKKYFKKLKEKPLKKLYFDKIQEIRIDPFIGELKTGDLAGIYIAVTLNIKESTTN